MFESLSVATLLFHPLLHRPHRHIACCDSLNTCLLSSFHLFPPDSPRPYLSEYLITALSCFLFFSLFSIFLSFLSLCVCCHLSSAVSLLPSRVIFF